MDWIIMFLGSSQKELIKADSRKEALNLYCQKEGIKLSSYLKCRKYDPIKDKLK